jgi:hypothetical protein
MSEQQSVENQTVAPSAKRSISSLVENLARPELERLAVDVILQNRRYLETAQALFERLQAEQTDDDDSLQLQHDYHLALINLNGHHQVVSAVIAALGYVPDIPCDPAPEAEPSTLN